MIDSLSDCWCYFISLLIVYFYLFYYMTIIFPLMVLLVAMLATNITMLYYIIINIKVFKVHALVDNGIWKCEKQSSIVQ